MMWTDRYAFIIGNSRMPRHALPAPLLSQAFLIAVVFLLSGCSQTPAPNLPPGAGSGAAPKTDGPRNIVVYSPHGALLEGDVKRRFEASHAGWTVEFLDDSGGV